jgi:hypothetical protein
VTLSGVFANLRLPEQGLKTIDPVLPSLWHCLLNLRTAADSEFLPRPERFRKELVRKKLNWHQLAEKEAARVRAVTGLPSKRTSRAAAWRNMAASFKKSIALTEADASSREEEVATGAVALYVPTYANEFKVGIVMAVWRYTALKKQRWGAKPTTMPVVRDIARYVRICELHAVPMEKEGVFHGTSVSKTAVVSTDRVVLFLACDDVLRGIEGIRVQLSEKSLQAYQKARTWEDWPNMLALIKSAKSAKKTQEPSDSSAQKPRGKKRKAESVEETGAADVAGEGEGCEGDQSGHAQQVDHDGGDAPSKEKDEKVKKGSKEAMCKKPLKSLSVKPVKTKKSEELPALWIRIRGVVKQMFFFQRKSQFLKTDGRGMKFHSWRSLKMYGSLYFIYFRYFSTF